MRFYSRVVAQSLLCYSKSLSRPPNPNHTIGLPLVRPIPVLNESLIYNSKLTTAAAEESKQAPSEAVSAIVNEIMELNLVEVSDLSELLRKKLGIEQMPVMAPMMPGMAFGGAGVKGKGSGAAAKAEEKVEKTLFDLKLEAGFDAGAKIKIIKEVRACTDLGLKEAKDLVEKAPAVLKKNVSKEEAEKIVEKMKEIGAKVTME